MDKSVARILTVLAAFVLVIGILAGSYVGVKFYKQEQARIKAEQEEQARRVEAAHQYETVLNDFLKRLNAEIGEYKKQSRVLREVIKPVNYENKEYARENYEEYLNTIAPELLQQTVRVMKVFDLATARLDALLEEKPMDTRQFIRSQWREVKDKSLKEYQTYFAAEETKLKAYEELLRFYYVKSKSYEVKDDAFVFKNPDDERTAKILFKNLGIQDVEAVGAGVDTGKPTERTPEEIKAAIEKADAALKDLPQPENIPIPKEKPKVK